MRSEVRQLPCKTCVDHGLLGLDGWQDVTNVNQLGRSLHNPERFAQFKAEVDKADESRTGRNSSYSIFDEGDFRRPSMAAKSMAVAAFGGSLLAYGIEVGIDSAAATFPAIIPGVGPKSLLNLAAAAGFAGLGYYMGVKKHKEMLGTLFFVSSAHHTTKIVDLFRTGGFPTQFVRPAPFVPAQQVSPIQPSYGSGGAAIF
jgi:hypothetical protein